MTMRFNSLEEQILSVWREILGSSQIGVDENFFDAGGTSILAARLAARLRNGAAPEISASDILVFPTVRMLARHLAPVDASSAPHSDSDQRATRQAESFARFRSLRHNMENG